MLVVRQAEVSDAARIHDLIVALAVYEREPDAVVCTVADLRDQLSRERPPFECLLAEEGGEARGFAVFFHNYSTWRGRAGLYLEDLFVVPEHRGRGIGKRLLSALAHIAKTRDCARLEWSVLAWNEPAIRFYESLGAFAMNGWTTYRLTGDALAQLARGPADAASD